MEITSIYSFLHPLYSSDETSYHGIGNFVNSFMLETMGQVFQRPKNFSFVLTTKRFLKLYVLGKSRSVSFCKMHWEKFASWQQWMSFNWKGSLSRAHQNILSDILSRWHLHSDSRERFLELTGDYELLWIQCSRSICLISLMIGNHFCFRLSISII